MAAGWKHFAGSSPYPEIGDTATGHIIPQYGPKRDRKFRIPWIEGRRDTAQEIATIRWIEAVSGERCPDKTDIATWLKNGVVLCKTMNSIQPNSITRVKLIEDPNQMENVMLLRDAIAKFGVPPEAMFGTTDLWEGSNMPKVIGTLEALAEIANYRNSRVPVLTL